MSVAKGFRLSDNSTAKLDWNYVTKPDGSKTIIEEVNDVKQDLQNAGLSEQAKLALLACFEKVAWINEYGQDYYDALESALFPTAVLQSISAVYTQSGDVYTYTSLDDLKDDLIVTGHYDDGSTSNIPSSYYTLSGTLTVGTSTITVNYASKTTTFDVTVTEKYYYDLTDGLTMLNYGIVPSAKFNPVHTSGEVVLDGLGSSNRRAFPTTIEAPRCMKFTSIANPYPQNLSDTEYYPIKIPNDATGVTVTMTPSTQYMSIFAYDYDETDHYTSDFVNGKSQTGWAQGTGSLSFSAGEYQYISISTKYDSGGSSYPTDPTALTVTFTTT